MPRHPLKGHAALRVGRVSLSGADYFLTLCTDQRRAGLAAPAVARAILAETQALHADETWHLRCLTIMPITLIFWSRWGRDYHSAKPFHG